MANMILKDKSLTDETLAIIRHQATERPFTASGETSTQSGSYLCRGCGLALLRTQMQFSSHCGWPSFDETIENAVSERTDTDGKRTEILCARCHAHLGHVFMGEGFTAKNRRHCVNSLSLDFVVDKTVQDSEEAIVAGGCFWGIQHYFNQLPGVLKTEVGYTGGHTTEPSYHDICTNQTGHYEAIRVLFDPAKLDYEAVLKYFFNIHDPTQNDGQGPDRGQQYQSAVFVYNDKQHHIATDLIQKLKQNGYIAATKILPMSVFWHAEEAHQHYYIKHAQTPYCHQYVGRL